MNENVVSYGYFNFIQLAAGNGLFHRRRQVSHLAMISKYALPVMWWAERSDSSDADLVAKALNKAYPQRDYLSGGSHAERTANRAVTNVDQGHGVIT